MSFVGHREEDLWLFGYGSLIWKPPPHFDKRVPGYVEGYVRRFWQASMLATNHPTAPPRVWGAAYHIPPTHVAQVKSYLDIREVNGYTIQYADFHVPQRSSQTSHGGSDPAPISCLVYVGLPTNPQFLGPQDPDQLARHILKSRGPSGENKEYLYNLAAALSTLSREAGVDVEVDEHVADLARRARLLNLHNG
ncbi:MAG: hypothetical protein M1831_000397 [Alyxoria varia]|nr:MAG: hypothetical protein M1831_000397 [Alyxoria varia]